MTARRGRTCVAWEIGAQASASEALRRRPSYPFRRPSRSHSLSSTVLRDVPKSPRRNTHGAGAVGKHALSRDQFLFFGLTWVTPICIVARRFRRGGRCEMSKLFAAIAITASLAAAGSAQAQSYPSRPITIVVPFPAGGPTDALARVLAERMKAALGQSVIVENPTGAAGTIGTGRVARAAPDGYTVILGHWQTHVVNGATYALPFDVVKDFEPISLVADCPVWFVAKAALPPKDLRELVAWMKENPGKATVGIGGVGGGADVVGTYFQNNTGTRFQFVPYRGAAPMIQDLLAGQIDLTFTQVASALAQV